MRHPCSLRFRSSAGCNLRTGAIVALTAALFAPAAADAQDREFFLGIQTHFAQGWQIEYLDLLPQIGTTQIRDDANWIYFTEDAPAQKGSPAIAAMKAAGATPLIVFPGETPLFDDGRTAHSQEGREAVARFVQRVLTAHTETIERIEIGNELNAPELGPSFSDDAARHSAQLIATVAAAARDARPDIEILCTGAHSVATGYLRDVFEHGALRHCDAISFHPYRGTPENVDVEIRRLRALIDAFGGDQALYVTEFGKWFENPAEAPDYMLKMVSLMGAAGVTGAYWYALLNEDEWPNMGLFHPDGSEMPAANAFRFLQSSLLPLGAPADRGESGKHHIYEFGSGGRAFVAWGAQGRLIVEGQARFFDSSGNPIAPVEVLDPIPVVILGDGLTIRVERDRDIHSALYGYGRAPWSYFARMPDRREIPFTVQDGNWDPYIGHPDLRPMKVTATSVDAAMMNDAPHHSVERFRVPANGRYDIAARWHQPEPDADGTDITVSLNGVVLAEGVATAAPFAWSVQALDLSEGDRLDFSVGPNLVAGNDWVDREITIVGP